MRHTGQSADRMYEVRELTSASQDEHVIKLAQEFSEDIEFDEEIDVDILRSRCVAMRQDIERNTWNCFLCYKNGVPIGFIVGTCVQQFHNAQFIAEKQLWFVSKEHRAPRPAKELFRAFEYWARSQGSVRIFAGSSNKRYSRRIAVLLERMGYKKVGTVHVKEFTK